MVAINGSVAVVQAPVNSNKLAPDCTNLTAPISGRIGRNTVTVGNLVVGGSGVNATVVTTIVSIDPIYLDFDVSESDFLAYQRAYAAGKLQSTRDATIHVFARLFDEDDWSLKGSLNFVDNR